MTWMPIVWFLLAHQGYIFLVNSAQVTIPLFETVHCVLGTTLGTEIGL